MSKPTDNEASIASIYDEDPSLPQIVHDDADLDAVLAQEMHPDAQRLFSAVPCLRKIPIFGTATAAYGPKLVVALGVTNALTKGAAGYIILLSRQPMFVRRYGVTPTRYNRLASMYSMGWSLKCFIAPISDLFPFLHFSKRWYMLVSAVAGSAFAFGYGLLPTNPSSGNPAAAFLFLTSFGKANVDILTQGLYSRAMRRIPAAGPTLVSWVWWMVYVGDYVTLIEGPLADAGYPHIGVVVSAVLQLIPAIFFVFNWLGELRNREERVDDAQRMWKEEQLLLARRRQDRSAPDHVHGQLVEPLDDELEVSGGGNAKTPPNMDEVQAVENVAHGAYDEPDVVTCLCGLFEFNRDVAKRNWRTVAFSIFMTAMVVALAVVNVLGDSWDLLITCIVVVVTCIGGAYLALPRAIASASVMVFCVFALYLSIPGALDAFYLATPDCVPNGPHFTYTFYITVGSVISYTAGMAGAVMFAPIFSRYRYQVTFAVTCFLQVLASLFDLIMLERWNIYIGIPDHAMYIFGYAIVYQIVHMLTVMPTMLLLSRLCPAGSESMVFAITAGFTNIGESMSGAIGSILLEKAWTIDTSSIPCDFSNVRYLIITGHLCLPLLMVPLSFLLLPHGRVCDEVHLDDNKPFQRDIFHVHGQSVASQSPEDSKTG